MQRTREDPSCKVSYTTSYDDPTTTVTCLLFEFLVVQSVIGVENGQLVILSPVLVEKKLSEEGEILCMPDVVRIACAKRDPCSGVSLKPNRQTGNIRTCRQGIQNRGTTASTMA